MLLIKLVSATTWTVKSDGSGDFANLAVAISAVSSGDTLQVGAGTWQGPFALSGKTLTIESLEGAEKSILTSSETAVFVLSAGENLTLLDITLEGTGVQGIVATDAVLIAKGLKLQGLGNETVTGGGASLIRTESYLEDCLFSSNYGYYGGGIYASGGSIQLINTVFDGNTASYGAAMLADTGTIIQDESGIWSKNTASIYGGALYQSDGEASFSGTVFDENISYYNGGAILSYGNLVIDGSIFRKNLDYYGGGAIYSGYNRILISNSEFSENESLYGSGGAIYQVYGVFITKESVFTANQAAGGGAIYALYSSWFEAQDTSFVSNEASLYQGGGVYLAGLTEASFNAVEFRHNHSFLEGGGLELSRSGPTTLLYSRLIENSSESFGGAVHSYQSTMLEVSRSWFLGNEADYGGALYLDKTQALLGNTRLEANVAGVGGALCAAGGFLSLYNSALLGNDASKAGAAVCLLESEAELLSNLIAWNGLSASIYGYDITASQSRIEYNAFYENFMDSGGTITRIAKGAVRKDPLLVAWSRDSDPENDNLALLADSPLIDAGDPETLDPDGSAADIGVGGGPGADTTDQDGDGVAVRLDCDDQDSRSYPGAEESWYNGVNEDCLSGSDFDQDGDGEDARRAGGLDCNDTNPRQVECVESSEEPGCGCHSQPQTALLWGLGGWLWLKRTARKGSQEGR